MEEHRRHVRVTTHVLIEFPNPATLKTERSFTQDISELGICFPTPVRLHVGQVVAFTLQLPFQNGTCLHTTGRVIWVREIGRLGTIQYEVGAGFRWTEPADRQRLDRFLHNFLSSKV